MNELIALLFFGIMIGFCIGYCIAGIRYDKEIKQKGEL